MRRAFRLLACCDRLLAELLEEFFDFERYFACAGTGSFVAVLNLSLCVFCESFKVGSELFNESFHCDEFEVKRLIKIIESKRAGKCRLAIMTYCSCCKYTDKKVIFPRILLKIIC